MIFMMILSLLKKKQVHTNITPSLTAWVNVVEFLYYKGLQKSKTITKATYV